VIDAELLLRTLLEAGKPEGVTIRPETDLGSIDELPLVLFRWRGDGQISNGPGLWAGTLDLTVLATGIDGGFTTARAIYDLVWSWDADPAAAIVTDVGWVSSVQDVSMFDRADGSVVDARGVEQFDGSFALELRA
jgi:hypothetical protein